MGAGQAFQWATSFPDMVERILPFCGSARASPHNVVSSNNTVKGLLHYGKYGVIRRAQNQEVF